ncbi:MAG: hypothetical protein IJV11_08115 [Muribaculaceae bacterium]|nr:hypothetical protein [Muribaculaceae bacterium]
MMTKRFLFISLLFLVAFTTVANEERKVRLSSDHAEEMLTFEPCNVFITKGETDANGMAKVTIQVESRLEDQAILLFHQPYSEKALKNGTPQITFWKNFPGSRVIENCELMSKDVIIEPSSKIELPMTLSGGNDSPVHLDLPIYIAKDKKNNFKKLELRELLVYTLDIQVETGPSKELLDLEERCNNLISEISGKSFCNNTKHKPSLEEQEAPYNKRIHDLNEEIKNAIQRHELKSGDSGYEKYASLQAKLAEIEFNEKCCKRCCTPPPPPKKCRKCGKPLDKCTCDKPCCAYHKLTLTDVYNRLDAIYMKIHNRKVTKQQVKGDATALYNHFKHIKNGSASIKNKIQERYNRIINAK